MACGNGNYVIAKHAYSDLKGKLLQFIQSETQKEVISSVSIYFRDLENGPTLGINEHEKFAPASLLKIPTLLTYLRLAEEDQELFNKKVIFRIEGEDPYLDQSFPPKETAQENTFYTIEELLRRMIVYSDNRSEKVLNSYLENISPDKDLLFEIMIDLGIVVPKNKVDEVITVKSYASIFTQLYNASFLEKKEMSEKALAMLARTEYQRWFMKKLIQENYKHLFNVVFTSNRLFYFLILLGIVFPFSTQAISLAKKSYSVDESILFTSTGDPLVLYNLTNNNFVGSSGPHTAGDDLRDSFSVSEGKNYSVVEVENTGICEDLTYNQCKARPEFVGEFLFSISGKGGGGDFVFTSSDGTTKLDHEIEKYVSSSGELWAWVEVPTLSVSADTVLYLYYGGPSTGATNQNVTGVWDTANNWQGVWHLKEDPTGTAPQMKDSTSNANNGTSNGGQVAGDQRTAKVDGGLNFDGVNDEVNVGNNSSLQLTGSMTVSAWMKPSSFPVRAMYAVTKDGLTGNRGWRFFACGDCTPTIWLFSISTDGTLLPLRESVSALTTNWTHVAGVYNAGAQTLDIYVNGVLDNGVLDGSVPASQFNSSVNAIIGDNAVDSNNFPGLIDEARVSNTARSADWIKTEYNNQVRPYTFAGFGGQQSR